MTQERQPDREFNNTLRDVMAPAVHEYYRQLCKKEGWPNKYDMSFDKLPEGIKEDNRDAAARIPEVIDIVGLVVGPKNRQGPAIDPGVLEENIELLAKAEHDGWMEQKFKRGWKLGSPRDDTRKIHNALIPYNDLPENDKKKDRNSVRSYPDIVKLAGYKIVHGK